MSRGLHRTWLATATPYGSAGPPLPPGCCSQPATRSWCGRSQAPDRRRGPWGQVYPARITGRPAGAEARPRSRAGRGPDDSVGWAVLDVPRLCARVRTLNVGEGLVHSLPEGFSCFCLAVQINVCVGLWQCLPVVPGSRPGPGSPPGRRPAPALLLLAKDSALCTCGGGAAWRARWELGAEGRRGACSAPRARTVARREPGRSGPPGSSARLRGRGPEVRAQARAQARGAGSRLRSGRPP